VEGALGCYAFLLRPSTDFVLSNVGVLVLRLGLGFFIAGFPGWHRLARGLAYLHYGRNWPLLDDVKGMGMPFVGAFVAIITQLSGDLAVAAGFLTRFAAFAVTIALLVAAYSNALTNEGNQLALLYAVCFAGFSLYRGGPYSVDEYLFGSHSTWRGMA
jgi:uncharacterized membrane protein YphA (DoxX/SURF4 family)